MPIDFIGNSTDGSIMNRKYINPIAFWSSKSLHLNQTQQIIVLKFKVLLIVIF